jgi:hypothetical protein
VRNAGGEFAGGFNPLELNFPGGQCGGSIEEKNNVRLADLLGQVGSPLLRGPNVRLRLAKLGAKVTSQNYSDAVIPTKRVAAS